MTDSTDEFTEEADLRVVFEGLGDEVGGAGEGGGVVGQVDLSLLSALLLDGYHVLPQAGLQALGNSVRDDDGQVQLEFVVVGEVERVLAHQEVDDVEHPAPGAHAHRLLDALQNGDDLLVDFRHRLVRPPAVLEVDVDEGEEV